MTETIYSITNQENYPAQKAILPSLHLLSEDIGFDRIF